MAVEDDAAWKEWEAALKRVTKAGDALKELSGSKDERKMDDAADELDDALKALDKAADKISPDDDDD